MAIAPSNSGASLLVRKMAVGPSAPPMMPMEAACGPVKPRQIAPKKATKTPSCAAAPRSRLYGSALSGPSSVMAPTPMKIREGYRPALTPM